MILITANHTVIYQWNHAQHSVGNTAGIVIFLCHAEDDRYTAGYCGIIKNLGGGGIAGIVSGIDHHGRDEKDFAVPGQFFHFVANHSSLSGQFKWKLAFCLHAVQLVIDTLP